MTTLEHKLWIEDYEARQEHSFAEDEIYEAAKVWQQKVDSGISRQELMRGGFDPDMFNEYSMVMDFCWDEIDSRYDGSNPLHQAICKFKKQRAAAFQEHRDPGAVPEKVQKYFSLAVRRTGNPGAVRNPQPRQRKAPETGRTTAPTRNASAGTRNTAPRVRNASDSTRNAAAETARKQADAARKQAKAAWKQAARPVSPKDGDGWLWPTVISCVVFALWGMIFQNLPVEDPGVFEEMLRWFGVGLDMIVNAMVVLSIIGKIAEGKDGPLPGFLNAYYRMIAFTFAAVRHPIRSTGEVFSKAGKNPLALLQLGWLVICWFAMLIGGILIMLVMAAIQAVNDYARPRRVYYY